MHPAEQELSEIVMRCYIRLLSSIRGIAGQGINPVAPSQYALSAEL